MTSESPLCPIKYDQNSGGVLLEKLGGGVRHASWNTYPISDQNLWFSLPYFTPDEKFDTLNSRPEALEPCAWLKRAWEAVTARTR